VFIEMSAERLADQDDHQLARHLRGEAGREALAELWRRHGPGIRAACLRVLRDPDAAADVAQDTFLRALQHIDDYRPGDFAGWLRAIARNLCLNRLRSAVARREIQWPEEFDVSGPVGANGRDRDEAERVLALLEELPEKQRVVLKLFYLDEKSYEEIVRISGLSMKEVKSAIQNGRRMLRKRIDER
jgi:RNA polymerase sigma-70 factor (ECF subfamily)